MEDLKARILSKRKIEPTELPKLLCEIIDSVQTVQGPQGPAGPKA